MRFRSLGAICVILLTACSGPAKYYATLDPVDLQKSGQEVTVRVLAEAAEWLNSGAMVKAGQQYHIQAAGQWSGGLICGLTGPDGVGASQVCLCRIIPGWSISTLLARINEDGVPFAVGNDYTFVAAQDGVLQFHINDPTGSDSASGLYCWPYNRDNQGYVVATISVPRIRQEVIDVKIVGYDNGVKTTKQKDYGEALLNAMRQAIERAGCEIKSSTTVKNFQLEQDYIESRARAILLPGFETIDIGYSEGGTYNMMLIGKIRVANDSVH